MKLFIGTVFEKEQLLQLNKIQQQWLPQIKEGSIVPANRLNYVWHFFNDSINSIDEINAKLRLIEGKCFYTSFCGMMGRLGGQIDVQLKTCSEFLSVKKQLEAMFINENSFNKKFRPSIAIFKNCDLFLPFAEAKKSIMLFNKPFLCTGFDLFQNVSDNKKDGIKSIFHYDLKK